MDKISHQNKTTLFWRKKAKINLHQNFPIYGIVHDAHPGHNSQLLLLSFLCLEIGIRHRIEVVCTGCGLQEEPNYSLDHSK
jgi:hypothetical protein